jgi:hypothetical protein
VKKTVLVALLAACAFALAQAQIKKYDIKSGIITFETKADASGMTVTTKSIVYFDDYGVKECKETYKGDALNESFFSDGKNLFAVYFADKMAVKRGVARRGTEFQFNWNDISDKDKKAGKAKQLPGLYIAGKQCDSFQYSDDGSTTKYAGWSRICLLTDLTSKDIHSVTKAVKVEENAKVSADKFAVPAGFAMK